MANKKTANINIINENTVSEDVINEATRNESLYDRLLSLKDSNEYPFHMPGHKRQVEKTIFDSIMGIDITEIPGFDNLHHPTEIIKKEMEYATSLYGTRQTFFLVNGSSCGVLASICATTEYGKDIILARNSHKSAYNAVYLQNLNTHYIYPLKIQNELPLGPVLAKDIEIKMKNTHAKVVFITSPSYEGVISDISSIAEVVHKNGGILIVDEAHGAHLIFDERFPKSAIECGADIVIQSLHKTMPALTQTALLHVCSDKIDLDRIRQYLAIYQTSSPSYILMASISKCLHENTNKRKSDMDAYFDLLCYFENETKALKKIRILNAKWVQNFYGAPMDPSKLVICVTHLLDQNGRIYGGKQLADDLLNHYHLQMELVSEKYVIAMTSVSDTKEGFDRLLCALKEIDQRLALDYIEPDNQISCDKKEDLNLTQALTIYNAMNQEKESVLWKDCIHKISAEYLYVYPPGTPILVPGEVITEDIYNRVERLKNQGLSVEGLKDYTLQSILVIKRNE